MLKSLSGEEEGSQESSLDQTLLDSSSTEQSQLQSSVDTTLEEIQKHDFVLTPGRYVGSAAIVDDGIPFETKMTDLSQTLYGQIEESVKLDEVIQKNLEGLGYGK